MENIYCTHNNISEISWYLYNLFIVGIIFAE